MTSILIPRVPVTHKLASRTCCTLDISLSARPVAKTQRLLTTSSTAQRANQHVQSYTVVPRQLVFRRMFATSPPAQPAISPAAPTANQQHNGGLPWDTFFAIRRTQRTIGFASGIIGGIAAAVIGAPLIGQHDLDTKIAAAVGIESVYALAGASILVAVFGYISGRMISGLGFGIFLRLRGWGRAYTEKENSLLHRIKRYRADPSNSSLQNPLPDYYGEKIKNVAGFRRWLRDQKMFQKKMYRDRLPKA